MAKRASTQESLVIAFEILKRIPKSHQTTAKELHKQLEEIGLKRELRTVQRTLEMLCEHFDIVKDDRTKPYGYKWDRNSESIALQKLAPQEALLLALSQDYLANLLPANLLSSLDGFFQEAKYQLNPSSDNNKEREWLKKVAVVSETQPLLPPKIDSGVFREISEALYHNRLLNIEYYNARQEHKSAIVMPLGLAQQGHKLYLVCRFDGYDNERSLAIHRISKAVSSTFTFDRPKSFKLSQYDADGRFRFGEGEKCTLSFSITKQAGFHLTETPLSKDQTISELDTHYNVVATVVRSKQLQLWLDGFGESVWDVSLTKAELPEHEPQ
ncbi:WYL domain-containing protein [Vibrio alginolyticus]|nr:WYL domain-containing protein [Vibrio alginolyticus]